MSTIGAYLNYITSNIGPYMTDLKWSMLYPWHWSSFSSVRIFCLTTHQLWVEVVMCVRARACVCTRVRTRVRVRVNSYMLGVYCRDIYNNCRDCRGVYCRDVYRDILSCDVYCCYIYCDFNPFSTCYTNLHIIWQYLNNCGRSLTIFHSWPGVAVLLRVASSSHLKCGKE